MVDCHADGFGLEPRGQVDDNPVDAAPAVQFAQQHQQVIANSAGHTAVRQLQRIRGGGQFAVAQRGRGPLHDVPVEPVLDDEVPGQRSKAPVTASASPSPATSTTGVRIPTPC